MVDKDIKEFILRNIKKHPTDITSFAAKELKVSRQAVYKHLKVLLNLGKIKNTGNKRIPFYQPEINIINLNNNLDEQKIWEDLVLPKLKGLAPNIISICEYGFTEMFNNVIDHSEGTSAQVLVSIKPEIKIEINDNGVGIFNKLMGMLKIKDEKEIVLHLTKGKLTSDSSRHSGEGIFFTSRVFDSFEICSGQLCYTRIEDDWFVKGLDNIVKGTRVVLKIDAASDKVLKDIFAKYTNSNFEFSTTEPMVELTLNKNETYISRSQAKRLLMNLDKFKIIVLDFKNVEFIGQGFVDEVFRVFKNAHTEIDIQYKNANGDVEFMIKRGL